MVDRFREDEGHNTRQALRTVGCIEEAHDIDELDADITHIARAQLLEEEAYIGADAGGVGV